MRIVLLLLSTFISFDAFSRAIIEESFWIQNYSQEFFEFIQSRPELIIDHVKESGLELYGPKGLENFLIRNQINYRPLQNISISTRGDYPTPEAIERELKKITRSNPDITKLYSIGKSVNDRNLWVMKLSRNAKVDDERPEFKYIANMHGDEIVGRELMLKFIKDCVKNYGKDPRITNLLDKLQIHILVSMNPDGAANASRGNADGVDLNRDFPDFSTSDNQDTPTERAPETQAVMKWQQQHKFKLSANFHGGAEVVNYPWDAISSPFPEEATIKELSLEYAKNAPYIAASTTFLNGVTNGYAWYKVNGGMQDWSIYFRRDFQVTIELSDAKWPDYSKIDYYYAQNRPALLRFIERLETLTRR